MSRATPQAPAAVLRLGYIDYLNCLPVYFGIERGAVPLPVELARGAPAEINRRFRQGEVDIAPISSIEWARHAAECLVLPGLSVAADGRVASILLFHRRPLAQARCVALTSASATSVVLTRIILETFHGLRPHYLTMAPDLDAMLAAADAALLIGDDALLAAAAHPELPALDLGEAWQAATGEAMVYALWAVRRAFAREDPAAVAQVAGLFQASQAYAFAHRRELAREAVRRRGLPLEVVEAYFGLIRHGLGPRERSGLAAFLARAQQIGELKEVPELRVWGDEAWP